MKKFIVKLIGEVNSSLNVVITGHLNADLDALGAAIGLKYFLSETCKNRKKKIKIIIPQLNKLSKKVYQKFIPLDSNCRISRKWPKTIDLLILVDVKNLEMTNIPYKDRDKNVDKIGDKVSKNGKELIKIKKIIYIDHHNKIKNIDPRVTLSCNLEKYSSSAEIITDFIQIYDLKLPLEIIKMLLTGIITDTGHFRYADSHSLEATKFLLDKGNLTLPDITKHLQSKMARAEKIARIRAGMRIKKLHYINNYVISISHVSTYGASACKGLMDLGSDVGFIISYQKKTNKFRISSRADERIINDEKLHLGDLMSIVGGKFNGSGGGHDGAAGCYGFIELNKKRVDAEDYMKILSPVLLKELRKIIALK